MKSKGAEKPTNHNSIHTKIDVIFVVRYRFLMFFISTRRREIVLGQSWSRYDKKRSRPPPEQFQDNPICVYLHRRTAAAAAAEARLGRRRIFTRLERWITLFCDTLNYIHPPTAAYQRQTEWGPSVITLH